MPKNVKTQWDFGERFGPAAARQVLTVSELTAQVRLLLERSLGQVWVTGEVSNLRAQSSGHVYFTLKDAGAQLSCVLFRGEPVPHRELLRDGQKLNLLGDFTVYEPRGQYQLVVRAVELQGTGVLQLAFERLKQKLQAEGLFAPERKRPLPRYARRIGVVTSPTGAAIRDVLHVLSRRQPGLELIIAGCRVQGDGAAREIANAIALLNDWSLGPAPRTPGVAPIPGRELDLILVTRGGGSLEDLWAFNEEVVARAIFDSALPVISAVGHEIDFTISDFVADLRAATPSAAAELITEGAYASRQFLAETAGYLRQLAQTRLDQEKERVQALAAHLARLHPRRLLQDRLQYLDDLSVSLGRCALQGLRRHRTAWQNLQMRLARLRPSSVLVQRRQKLLDLRRRMSELVDRRLRDRRHLAANLSARLRLLAPQNVLARGYSITLLADSGRLVRKAADAQPGQKLLTRLRAGQIRSVVEKRSTKG